MKDDELDLWRLYRMGDQEALEGLLLCYKRLVRFWAGNVMNVAPQADQDELMQEGLLGVLKAMQRFDPDKGIEFSTYASGFIRGALYDNLRRSRNLTRHLYENFRKINRAQEEILQSLGRKPAIAEIAQRAGLTEKQVENTLDAVGIAFPDGLIEGDEDSPKSVVKTESPETIILIGELLPELNERQRRIVTEYYYMGRTDQEIAGQLSTTTGNVKKIRQRALKKLLSLLEMKPGGERNED